MRLRGPNAAGNVMAETTNSPKNTGTRAVAGSQGATSWLLPNSILALLTENGIMRAALAFSAGALLTSGFSPTNFLLAPFLVVPLFILLIDTARGSGGAFRSGWWAGFGCFLFGLSWIGHSFTQQDNVPVVLAPFATAALAALMALYTAATFWLSKRLWCAGWLRVLLFATVWTLFEFARGYWFTGFPWNLLGSMWADWLPVAQAASVVTVYGLTGVTLLASGALVLFIGPKPSLGVISYSAFAALLMPALYVWGDSRLDDYETEYELGVGLRLVQANVQQHEKWVSHLIDDHFDKHLDLSRGNSTRGKAESVKVLIWPESAVQRENFDREGSLLRWRMSRLLEFGAFAVTGVPRYERSPDGIDYYNSLVAFNSRGQLFGRYDKTHLVPFGEYIPLQGFFSLFGLDQLAGSVSFTPGEARTLIQLPGVPSFAPLICYEVIFPGGTGTGEERPGWILNITNDGWFGVTNGPHQHLALARFRAIEEGLPLVRSASTGISAVIDPYGRVISKMGINRQGILDSPLPSAADAPQYSTRFKLLMVLAVCGLIFFGYLMIAIVRQRQSEAPV